MLASQRQLGHLRALAGSWALQSLSAEVRARQRAAEAEAEAEEAANNAAEAEAAAERAAAERAAAAEKAGLPPPKWVCVWVIHLYSLGQIARHCRKPVEGGNRL